MKRSVQVAMSFQIWLVIRRETEVAVPTMADAVQFWGINVPVDQLFELTVKLVVVTYTCKPCSCDIETLRMRQIRV